MWCHFVPVKMAGIKKKKTKSIEKNLKKNNNFTAFGLVKQ